jgi:hypothetical protein
MSVVEFAAAQNQEFRKNCGQFGKPRRRGPRVGGSFLWFGNQPLQ